MTIPESTPAAATLDELIEVLNDGINFFGDAADLSRVDAHARLFRELRLEKQAIAEALRAAAPLGTAVRQQEGSLSAALRQGYTDLRARLSDDPDDVYIAALEAQEDRILDAFESAVAHAAPSPVRDVAREKLARVLRMHSRLSALKHAQVDAAATPPLFHYPSASDIAQENPMAKKSLDRAGVDELLYQALETEIGGIQVYETAISCATNAELREEWQKYLEETHRHHEILLSVFDHLGLDPDARTPGRDVVAHIGRSLVEAMEMAKAAGDPDAAQIVAGECVVHAESKDHMNWELIGQVVEKGPKTLADVLREPHAEVEDQEDHHYYHTKGWTRELWLQSLGLPAVLPPPEEVKQVETAIGASRAEQQRDQMLKKH
jgi:uncharacterized protein (TIGR02284 family)